MRKWIPPVLVAASYAFSWFAHSRLPLEVVLRWDALLPWVGPADAEALPRAAAAFAIPTLAVAVWLLLRGLASSSGERLGRRLFPDWLLSARTGARAVGRFGPTYDVIVGLVVAFLLLFHTATLGTALDWPEWTLRAFTSLVGVGLMVLGNIMPRTRPNWIAGLRTQRTLSDPDLWRRTHRYFGALLMLTGVAVIAASWLAASYALVIGLGGFLASALVASILGRARSGPRGTEATSVVLVLSMVPLAGPVCLTAETVLPPASRDAAEHPFDATSSGLPSSDQEAGLGGEWSGVWTRGADTLEVRMRLAPAGDGWTGAFDAERLRVDGIPFTTVEFAAPAARFSIAGDATTTWFEGRVAGDSLVGTLEENGAPGTVAFGRSSPSPASREEEVRFANGEVERAGTLILPDGPGPHPAVVFLHGSGAEGRWASRFLARRLVAAGMAALIYDKRGVGGSTGAWPDAGFEDLTATARVGPSRRWLRFGRRPTS